MVQVALKYLLIANLLSFGALSVDAGEAEMKSQIEALASSLVERLPSDRKIVLKTLPPDETGLPEDFLRKLVSDLEAALLSASEYDLNLANRFMTEEIWSEAIEFNDADFENLHAATNADILMMVAPRVTGAGLEISLTAYDLVGEDAGRVLAASGSTILAMDIEQNLGVDVTSLNDQLTAVLDEIEKAREEQLPEVGIADFGTLILSPSEVALGQEVTVSAEPPTNCRPFFFDLSEAGKLTPLPIEYFARSELVPGIIRYDINSETGFGLVVTPEDEPGVHRFGFICEPKDISRDGIRKIFRQLRDDPELEPMGLLTVEGRQVVYNTMSYEIMR